MYVWRMYNNKYSIINRDYTVILGKLLNYLNLLVPCLGLGKRCRGTWWAVSGSWCTTRSRCCSRWSAVLIKGRVHIFWNCVAFFFPTLVDLPPVIAINSEVPDRSFGVLAHRGPKCPPSRTDHDRRHFGPRWANSQQLSQGPQNS